MSDNYEPVLSDKQLNLLWGMEYESPMALMRAIASATLEAERKNRVNVLAESVLLETALRERITTLESQRDELERDARRYRFIRDADQCDHDTLSYRSLLAYSMESLDEAIDAAIAAAWGSSHG